VAEVARIINSVVNVVIRYETDTIVLHTVHIRLVRCWTSVLLMHVTMFGLGSRQALQQIPTVSLPA